MTPVLNECQGHGRHILVCFDPYFPSKTPSFSALRSIKANGREHLQTFANSPSNFDCWRQTFATNCKRILRWYAS